MSTISVPVPITVCDCGHPPTPTAGIGTGYGRHSVTMRTMCYDCCTERDRQAFRNAKYGDPPIYAYVRDPSLKLPGVHPDDSRKIEIINWPGAVLGRGYITRATRGLGGPRHQVVATIEGRNWHGRWYPRAGDYTGLRLYKEQ